MRQLPDGRADALPGLRSGNMGSHPGRPRPVPRREVVAVTHKRFKVALRRDPDDGTMWLANVIGTQARTPSGGHWLK